MTDFEQKIAYLKSQVSDYLRTIVAKEHPVSLYEPIKYTIDGGGKRLRPILLILAAEALGASLQQSLPAAAAVELLHNFTLVHDDIMDQDDTRRGRPTVHSRWDTDVALLAGDGLVALAYQSLLATPGDRIVQIAKIFTAGLIDLCEGQALDREFETRNDVSLDDYLDMISKKTASLLSMCACIGGHIAGGDDSQIEALQVYGKSLGMAFQIQDDLLDIVSDQKTLGKDFGSDVRQKKKTFLWVHARNHAEPSQVEALTHYFNLPHIETEHIYKVRDIFMKAGTLNRARDFVHRYIDSAEQSLKPLEAGGVKTEDLKQLLHLIAKREA